MFLVIIYYSYHCSHVIGVNCKSNVTTKINYKTNSNELNFKFLVLITNVHINYSTGMTLLISEGDDLSCHREANDFGKHLIML